ncbi:Protein of unknown function [Bacillus wiedmannii]|nr:Protein of unknown function [Bacillus wiedmannii]
MEQHDINSLEQPLFF